MGCLLTINGLLSQASRSYANKIVPFKTKTISPEDGLIV